MKIKSLALILSSVALLASCSNQPASTSNASSEPEGSSSPAENSMLKFIENGKIYFDMHETDVHFSYGNAALQTGKNELAFNNTANLTVEGTPAQEYNFIFVHESLGGFGKSIFLGIEAESLVEFMSTSVNDLFSGKTRLFVAISAGSEAKWTHNLNEELDSNLTIWVNGLKA